MSPTSMFSPVIWLTLNLDVFWSHPWLSTTNPDAFSEDPKFITFPFENRFELSFFKLILYLTKLESKITDPKDALYIPAEDIPEIL